MEWKNSPPNWEVSWNVLRWCGRQLGKDNTTWSMKHDSGSFLPSFPFLTLTWSMNLFTMLPWGMLATWFQMPAWTKHSSLVAKSWLLATGMGIYHWKKSNIWEIWNLFKQKHQNFIRIATFYYTVVKIDGTVRLTLSWSRWLHQCAICNVPPQKKIEHHHGKRHPKHTYESTHT